jgi:hypothetical protein
MGGTTDEIKGPIMDAHGTTDEVARARHILVTTGAAYVAAHPGILAA